MSYQPATAVATRAYGSASANNRQTATLKLEAVNAIAVATTLSSYIVAKYDLSVIGATFTLVPYQTWPGAVNCIPAISYIQGSVTTRWLLSPGHVGRVQYDLYSGQAILNSTPTLELWSTGVASTFSFAEVTINAGLLLPRTDSIMEYTITPCINSVNGSVSDFNSYVNSCQF